MFLDKTSGLMISKGKGIIEKPKKRTCSKPHVLFFKRLKSKGNGLKGRLKRHKGKRKVLKVQIKPWCCHQGLIWKDQIAPHPPQFLWYVKKQCELMLFCIVYFLFFKGVLKHGLFLSHDERAKWKNPNSPSSAPASNALKTSIPAGLRLWFILSPAVMGFLNCTLWTKLKLRHI